MDVRSRAEDAVGHLVANDDDAALSAHRLARLGGAALPYVVPELDNLPPAARGRVAVALAPIAERMGFGDPKLEDPVERARLASVFEEGLGKAIGYVLPLRRIQTLGWIIYRVC